VIGGAQGQRPDDPGPPHTPGLKDYLEILRPQNVVPSMLLAGLGAWVATHDIRHVLDINVFFVGKATAHDGIGACYGGHELLGSLFWRAGVISALVAVGSCVLNDWFDLKVDAINKPDVSVTSPCRRIGCRGMTCLPSVLASRQRSLVRGSVSPSHALAIGSCCLALAFWSAASLQSLILRQIVRFAVVAVTLYTPVFKPLPFVKNAVVAGVTAGESRKPACQRPCWG
jgi:4-hydroxybenzoate polyprenyltransferase